MSSKTKIAEITAVVITAIGKFIFIDGMKSWLPFVVTAILGWVAYIVYRNKRSPGIAKHWGFRTDNFSAVLRKVLPFGLFAVAACMGIGLYQGTINITWHIIPILILYPIWGVIQQFLLIALTAGNMQDLKWNNLFGKGNTLNDASVDVRFTFNAH